MASRSVRRLVLLSGSLTSGGAEKILAGLANWWAEQGHSVTIVTLESLPDDYVLHRRIGRVAFDLPPPRNKWGAVRGTLRRVQLVRRALHDRPDVVVSFQTAANAVALAAGLGLGTPIVVSERVDPRVYSPGRFWELSRRFLYPRARRMVIQSPSIRPWARRFVTDERIAVIPNAVEPPTKLSSEDLDLPRPRVVGLGRLTYQKGFDLLVRAFGRVAARYPEWQLVLCGRGEEREGLETLAATLGLGHRVHLPGHVATPVALTGADIFVLSSRFEGFPNALLEAMSYRLPVIATDCPSGPGDIVRHALDGLLVPPESVEALAKAMAQLMSEPTERERLARNASRGVRRFATERVMAMWDELIAAVTEEQVSPRSPRRGKARPRRRPGPLV